MLCGELKDAKTNPASHFPLSHVVGDISSLLCSLSLGKTYSQGPGYVFSVVLGKEEKNRPFSLRHLIWD